MTDTVTDTKPTRRLKNFDFSEDGAHIALVHKDQGGAANGYKTLVMKSTGKYSTEFLQKATQIQVTLTFEEFLGKFFDMWYTDAKVLATMLGMQDDEEDEDDSDWYKNRIAEQVDKFEILKSANDAESKTAFLAELDEDAYMSLLQNQEKFEKALEPKAKSGGKKPVKKAEKSSQSIVNKAQVAVHNEENPMPNSAQPELIAKAQYDEVQKALDTQKVELQKAAEVIEKYKQAEKAQITKARQASILAAIETEAEAEKLFKAVSELPEESFQAVVEVVKGLTTKLDASALFTEQGSPAEGEHLQKSALRAQLEKQLAKSK